MSHKNFRSNFQNSTIYISNFHSNQKKKKQLSKKKTLSMNDGMGVVGGKNIEFHFFFSIHSISFRSTSNFDHS